MERLDYRKAISQMTTEEFVRFCSILRIDLNRFHVRHNDQLKKCVGDLISKSFHRLRNDQEQFKRFNSILTDAFFKVEFE